MAQTVTDLNAARSLLALEGDFCDLDMAATELARRIEAAGLPQADRHAREVRRARQALRKTLWRLSGFITEAVGVIERHGDAEVPF